MDDWHKCRICGEASYHASDDMLRYGKRHWAHKRCYLFRERSLDKLSNWQIGTLPFFVLKELGLDKEAERRFNLQKD